jgi:hypothetical protein
MHLVGQLSNPPNQSTMTILEVLAGDLTAEPVIELPQSRRLGNGVVRRAVIKVLVEADRPMDVGEAHTRVERVLGYPVSRDSVNGRLSTGVRRAPPNFQRVGPAATGSIALPDIAAAPSLPLFRKGGRQPTIPREARSSSKASVSWAWASATACPTDAGVRAKIKRGRRRMGPPGRVRERRLGGPCETASETA